MGGQGNRATLQRYHNFLVHLAYIYCCVKYQVTSRDIKPSQVAMESISKPRSRTGTAGSGGGSPSARSSPGEKSTNSAANAMLDVKNNRKRAEADLQLLANRIALLRTEEAKAMVKISETKTRAKEILAFKKRNEDELQGRMSSNVVKV